MTQNFSNTPARSRGYRLAAGSNTVYAVSTNTGAYAQAIDLNCANVSAAEATVTVEWFRAKDNQTYRIIYQGKIPVNEARHYNLDAFGLEPGDQIRVTPNAVNTVDAIITVLEVPGRSG